MTDIDPNNFISLLMGITVLGYIPECEDELSSLLVYGQWVSHVMFGWDLINSLPS